MSDPIQLVLFDLDGTLIDSWPDLAGAANDMRLAHGLPALADQLFRPHVGQGARGMLKIAFNTTPEAENFHGLKEEFLQRYEKRLTQKTVLFPSIGLLLDFLDNAGVAWGIVTNKAKRFAVPLVRALNLQHRMRVLIAGDTTPYSKPHPEPLFEAARQAKTSPSNCVYVGDDLRDIQAGRAANMPTIAVTWGYLGAGEPVSAWGADYIVSSTNELLKVLKLA